MIDVAELVDRGIKAYVAGRTGEALELFQEVLEHDPGNARAFSYTLLIRGSPGAIPAPSRTRPVPTPAPQGAVFDSQQPRPVQSPTPEAASPARTPEAAAPAPSPGLAVSSPPPPATLIQPPPTAAPPQEPEV